MTQPKTDLAYLRSEKAKAEQQLRYYQHREKILEHQIPELTRKARPSGSVTMWCRAAFRMLDAVRKAARWEQHRARKYSRMLRTEKPTAHHA